MKKPNVLFLFADDQRFDTINALGNKAIKTPALDKLVNNGTTFTHAHIPGGTCGAICMPSRAMLNTGRSLFNLDREGQEVPKEHTLMGEIFQQQGYETFGTGKWHNGKSAYARSFTDGDSIFFGGMQDHWMVPFFHFDETGKYDKEIKRCWDFQHSNGLQVSPGEYVRASEHSTDIIAESVIKFLDKKHDKPFLAYAAFLAPHDPRTMPQEFIDMYNPDDIELPPNFANYHSVEYDNWNCRDEVLAPYPRTIEDTKKQIAEYYAMITHLDYQIGRILDKLEEIGEKDNTVIVYAADNGLAVGQHGLFGKQSVYDHSVRVPLIFAGKDIIQGVQNESLVYLYDILPTLCDVLGFEKPESIMGKSFIDSLENKTQKSRDELYFVYTDKLRGITKNGFKYMEHRYKGITTKQMFNLKNDPYETSNLVQDPNYADVLADMQETMREQGRTSNELNCAHGKGYWKEEI